jgi:DNA-binding CsgD family transcriptional regulator
VPDTSINQIYIANIDLLKLFILHFNEKIRQSKLLSQAYNLKFSIDENAEGHLIKARNNKSQRTAFLQTINLNNSIASTIEKSLSARELEVLAWLHYGKRASDIAQIIGVAEITVNKHILNIKEKTQCYTPFQLGEFFSTMFHHSDEIIDYFIRAKKIK